MQRRVWHHGAYQPSVTRAFGKSANNQASQTPPLSLPLLTLRAPLLSSHAFIPYDAHDHRGVYFPTGLERLADKAGMLLTYGKDDNQVCRQSQGLACSGLAGGTGGWLGAWTAIRYWKQGPASGP